jgi:2-dehydropantoate 2-reductase
MRDWAPDRKGDMKVAIVGTGAMGSVYAGRFGKAGHEVWAIDLWQEHLDVIASSGLTVSGASGTYVVEGIQVARTASEAAPCDVWVIATKAADVEGVAAQIAPFLEPGNMVMALQNGLGAGERVARHIPESQIVIGIAEGFGSSIPGPGHVHHEGMRLIRIGEMNGGMTERVRELERLWLDAGFNARAFADVNVMVWEKFLCNVTLSAPWRPGRSRSDARRRPIGWGSPWASSSTSTTRWSTCPSSPPRFPTPARPCDSTIWRDVPPR